MMSDDDDECGYDVQRTLFFHAAVRVWFVAVALL